MSEAAATPDAGATSEAARRDRAVKRGWARPGSAHDWLVGFLKILLPLGVGVVLAYLLLSPLSKTKENSFLLDKNKVEVAHERLKTQSAEYRGLDDQGRPFTVQAQRAVQPTAAAPLVNVNGMAAQLQMKEGPATVNADQGQYNIDKQQMQVQGPVHVKAANGYRLETRDVNIDLNTHKVTGSNGVEGTTNVGTFRADNMTSDIRNKSVVLTGRAHLHITQGGLRGGK
jgi:lipopolysaccharide export system protein LptC